MSSPIDTFQDNSKQTGIKKEVSSAKKRLKPSVPKVTFRLNNKIQSNVWQNWNCAQVTSNKPNNKTFRFKVNNDQNSPNLLIWLTWFEGKRQINNAPKAGKQVKQSNINTNGWGLNSKSWKFQKQRTRSPMPMKHETHETWNPWNMKPMKHETHETWNPWNMKPMKHETHETWNPWNMKPMKHETHETWNPWNMKPMKHETHETWNPWNMKPMKHETHEYYILLVVIYFISFNIFPTNKM